MRTETKELIDLRNAECERAAQEADAKARIWRSIYDNLKRERKDREQQKLDGIREEEAIDHE